MSAFGEGADGELFAFHYDALNGMLYRIGSEGMFDIDDDGLATSALDGLLFI